MDIFELTIAMGNDAMKDCEQIAVALEDVKWRVFKGATEGPIMDMNGNKVGQFALTTSEEE
jgi:hypothetical protein